VDTAAELIEQAARNGVRLILPVDVVVADDLNPEAKGKIVPVDSIPLDKKIVDIGPQTIENFRKELRGSRTVFWNGPVGVEEVPQFAEGTKTIAGILVGLKATTIIGGGSTAEVINAMGSADKITFVSTGGGASLKFLGGEDLPGVVTLRDKEH
jgi:phosphoglycerate kinase